MSRCCVIGVGAAGISAFTEMRAAGYEVECSEKTGRVGCRCHAEYAALRLMKFDAEVVAR